MRLFNGWNLENGLTEQHLNILHKCEPLKFNESRRDSVSIGTLCELLKCFRLIVSLRYNEWCTAKIKNIRLFLMNKSEPRNVPVASAAYHETLIISLACFRVKCNSGISNRKSHRMT